MSFYKSLFNLTQVEADILRFPTGAAQGLFLVCADSDGTFSWQNIGNYAVTNLTGVSNRIIITNNGGGSYTISAPQDIGTTSTPTFNQIRLTSSPVSNYFLRSDSSGNGSWAPISSHAITDIFGTANQIIVTKNINNEATLSTPQNLDTACNFQTASTTASNIINSPVYQITDIPGAQWRLTNGNFYLNFFKQNATSPFAFPTTPLIWFEAGNIINSSIFRALPTNRNCPTYTFQGHLDDGLYHNGNNEVGLVNSNGYCHLATNGDFHISEDLVLANNKSIFIGSDEYKQADLNKITGITNGTASANKALVVDNQRRISNIDQITTDKLSVANIISNVDFNNSEINYPSQININNGVLTDTALNFYSHNAGIYSSSNRHLNFVSNNIDRFEITDTTNTSKQRLNISTGGLYTNDISAFSSNIINFSNTTNPIFRFNSNTGFAPPSYTTQSVGQKIIIWPELNGSNANYALGLASGEIYLNSSNRNTIVGIYNGDTRDAYISQNGLHVNQLQSISGDLEVKTNIDMNNNSISNVSNFFSNVFIALSGSITDPSYSFFGKAGLGMFSPAIHTIGFTCQNIERLRISNTAITAYVDSFLTALTTSGLLTSNGNAIFNATVINNNTVTNNGLNIFNDVARISATGSLSILGSMSSNTTANLSLSNLLTITNTTTAGNLYLQNNNATANTNLRLLHCQANLTSHSPYIQINRNNTVSDLEFGIIGTIGNFFGNSVAGDVFFKNHNNRKMLFGFGANSEVDINPNALEIPLMVNTQHFDNITNFGYLNNGGSVGYYSGPFQNWGVSLYTQGAIVCNGQIMVISDKRTKTDIVDIDEKIIEDFLKIDTKQFKKDGQQKPQYGYIAQDLAKISPNFVNLFKRDGYEEVIDNDGFISPKDYLYSVNYECIDAVQHMIIKKQAQEIKTLKEQLNNVMEILARNNIA